MHPGVIIISVVAQGMLHLRHASENGKENYVKQERTQTNVVSVETC